MRTTYDTFYARPLAPQRGALALLSCCSGLAEARASPGSPCDSAALVRAFEYLY